MLVQPELQTSPVPVNRDLMPSGMPPKSRCSNDSLSRRNAMFVYLAPFLYVVALLLVYLYGPPERRAVAQKNIRTQPNFYLGCGVTLSFLAIFGYRFAYYGSWWLAALTWLAAIVLA